MSQINPFAGSIIQSTQVQRQQAVSKDRQMRRQTELAKNVALQDDRLEHEVESAEVIGGIGEQRKDGNARRQPPRKPEPPKDEEGLDITA